MLILGFVIIFWWLGFIGVVDEILLLFVVVGWVMVDIGDWLMFWVNGLFCYDKLFLVYWLMGFGYVWFGCEVWDFFGSWVVWFFFVLVMVGLMFGFVDMVLCWLFFGDVCLCLMVLIVLLVFVFLLLVFVWSCIVVSDVLLCGLFGFSLLL